VQNLRIGTFHRFDSSIKLLKENAMSTKPALSLLEIKQYELAFRRMSGGSERLPRECLPDLLAIMGLSITSAELETLTRTHAIHETVAFPSVIEMYCEHIPKESTFMKEFMMFCSLLDTDDMRRLTLSDLRQALCTVGDKLTDQEFNHLLYSRNLLHKTSVTVFEVLVVLLGLPPEALAKAIDHS